jgi:type II secretory pathway pseudopilin PulG
MIAVADRSPRGFSLLEFVIVVGIVVVTGGLILSGLVTVRETANQTTCKDNLRQIVLACHHCETVHGTLPPAIGPFDRGDGTALFHLLPYLEQANLYQSAPGPDGIYRAQSPDVRAQPIKVFCCPSDPSTGSNGVVTDGQGRQWGASSYAGNAWVFGRIWALSPGSSWREASTYQPGETCFIDLQRRARYAEITDGLQNTILIAEKYARCTNGAYPEGGNFWAYWKFEGPEIKQFHPAFGIPWNDYCVGPTSRFLVRPWPYTGEESNCDPTLASTPHRTMNVALVDGSVHSLSPTLSGQTWWAACTPAGNDVLGSDW